MEPAEIAKIFGASGGALALIAGILGAVLAWSLNRNVASLMAAMDKSADRIETAVDRLNEHGKKIAVLEVRVDGIEHREVQRTAEA
jgi:hypothetical protein